MLDEAVAEAEVKPASKPKRGGRAKSTDEAPAKKEAGPGEGSEEQM